MTASASCGRGDGSGQHAPGGHLALEDQAAVGVVIDDQNSGSGQRGEALRGGPAGVDLFGQLEREPEGRAGARRAGYRNRAVHTPGPVRARSTTPGRFRRNAWWWRRRLGRRPQTTDAAFPWECRFHCRGPQSAASASCGFSPSLLTPTPTSPCSVNLIALPSRFTRIWRRRPGSPRNRRGTSGSTDAVTSRPLLPGLIHHQFDRALDRNVKIEVDLLEGEFARGDLGVVENVVDQAQQRVTAFAHVMGKLALLGVEFGIEQQAGHADDRVERGANLVTHVGQEFRFQPRALQGRVARLRQFRLHPLAIADILRRHRQRQSPLPQDPGPAIA